jgi:hypothetical protein
MTTPHTVSDSTVSGTALLIHEALARSHQHGA